MTLIKICGVTSVEDALACASMGANMLGFIFADSPRRVEARTVCNIQRVLGSDIKSVGVFTDESDEALETIRECEFSYVQLHSNQSEDFARRVGASRVIRVARVADEASVDALAAYKNAAFYLLDTYSPAAAGGTGETFDWNLAIRAKTLGKPVLLSGGLNAANVVVAVRQVAPLAVDVSSGVESAPGVKDHAKVKEFIDNVRAADNAS